MKSLKTVITLPPRPGSPTAVPPPRHLASTERRLWTGILASRRFDDAGGLALLTAALESHQRARQCRERIDADGEVIVDRLGGLKPHPLLTSEHHAKTQFLSAMKLLRLDLGGISG